MNWYRRVQKFVCRTVPIGNTINRIRHDLLLACCAQPEIDSVDNMQNRRKTITPQPLARVAELADALDLGSSGETRAGSTPVSRTIFCIP